MSVGRLKRDCHEIRLASAKLLPTTSLRLAIVSASSFVAVNRSRGEVRVPSASVKDGVGNCDNGNTTMRLHSRFAGQELVRICNHKFV
jgi:hypothetical protein